MKSETEMWYSRRDRYGSFS